MMTYDTAVRLPPGGCQSEVEMGQFAAGLRVASQTGARVALRLVELLERIVEEFCVKFEQSATPAMTRIIAR